MPHASQKTLAFTLSELLIALAILGLIATFTVPKVLHGIGEQQSKTVLKETIAMMGQILGEYFTENCEKVYQRDKLLLNKLNATKVCHSAGDGIGGPGAGPGGCWIDASQGCVEGWGCNPWYPGALLHNGASVTWWYNAPHYYVWIDYNGVKGPNVKASVNATDYDQITFIYYGSQSSSSSQGKLVGGSAGDRTAYSALFK
jgi:prepilin-type N-terminal cleavage/methylation domain-containing protein